MGFIKRIAGVWFAPAFALAAAPAMRPDGSAAEVLLFSIAERADG